MENKIKFIEAMKADNGKLNEIDLGESLFIGEDETMKIISALLTEHKIEYVANGACNYRNKRNK